MANRPQNPSTAPVRRVRNFKCSNTLKASARNVKVDYKKLAILAKKISENISQYEAESNSPSSATRSS